MKKWFVRGLVLFCLGSMVLVALAYQYWTNPESVRRLVLDRLNSDFLNTQATLDSARLRLFGGIEIREVRLSRKDDLDRSDFLYVPSATLFHDKEQVLEGTLCLRKVEIRRPRIRVIRDHEGRWNIAGLLGPSKLGQRAPAIVIRQGTLVVEDRQAAAGTPPLEIRDLNLTLLNDPLPVITFEGTGTCEAAGSVRIRGRATRGGGPLALSIELPDLTLGPELVQRVAGYAPEAAVHLRRLNARAKLHVELVYDSSASRALNWTVRGDILSGEFAHALLPWPLEKLSGSFSATEGMIPEAKLRACAGPTELEATLHDVYLGPDRNALDRAERLQLRVRHLAVNANLFQYLPAKLQSYNLELSPEGIASIQLDLKRLGPGSWRQFGSLDVEDGRGRFHTFDYPVSEVRGNLQWQQTTNLVAASSPGQPDDWVSVDLSAAAGGQATYLRGRIEGERGQTEIKLDLWGNNMPLDNRLLSALPPKPQYLARNFAPSGRFDYRVFLRRARGEKEISKRFLFHLHHCKTCYKVFPLPLTGVSGTLDIRPDSWEFRDFIGHYNGGTIRASGRSWPLGANPSGMVAQAAQSAGPIRTVAFSEEESESRGSNARVSVTLEGDNLPIDDSFKAALAPGRESLVKAFDTFALTGRLNFKASIDDLPNQPRDVDVNIRIGGCRINPAFFSYPLEEVAATVHYARNNLAVSGFQGRHGNTVVYVKQANVVLPPEGGFWVKLDRLQASPLALDADLQKALPGSLGKLARSLKLTEPVNLATELVLSQSPAAGARPTVYWDAVLALKDTRLNAGSEWSNVTGCVSCKGLHNGHQVEDVVGNIYLEKATVFNQPLRNVHLPLMIRKDKPDILRIPDLKADLFGGTLDGQARIEFGSIFRYEMKLDASRIQLEQLGRHNFQSAQMSGLANASLHVAGEGSEVDGIKGNGRLDVPSGKMYRLPLLLDLLKWLGFRLPDRTAFEQAHAGFRIEGPRLHVTELELYGNAVSVRGQGSMRLDGDEVKLDLNADWGRLSQMLPSSINNLSRELSNQLLRVKVRGKVGALKFEQELVPIVTDPLKKILNGLSPARGDKTTR